MVNSIPVFWVKSEAEAVADAPCSALPLEGAGLRYKSFHQGTHLAALMVPEQKKINQVKASVPNRTKFHETLMEVKCELCQDISSSC